MISLIKIFIISFIVLAGVTVSNAADLLTVDDAGKLQGNLQNVPLSQIKSFFENKYGIAFLGDDNIFKTQVTLSFSGLPLEKTLKRVFSKVHVAFMYNSKGDIIEVRVFPSNTNQRGSLIADNFMNKESPLTAETTEVEDISPIPGDSLPGEAAQPDQNDPITSFQVEENSPPPEESLSNEGTEVDQNDEITSFQVEVNSPPSGDSFLIVPVSRPAIK